MNLRANFHKKFDAHEAALAKGDTERAAHYLGKAMEILEQSKQHRATRPATARPYGGSRIPKCLRTEKDFRPNKPPAAPRPACRRPPPAAARPLVQKEECAVQEPPSLTVSFL